jgi:hypothetical protein
MVDVVVPRRRTWRVVFMEVDSIIAACADALLASRMGIFLTTMACVDQPLDGR